MPLDLPSFKKSLKSTFNILNKSQAEALAVEIAANYTAGRTAAETHQSIKSAANYPAASPDDPEAPEEEGLTTEEKAEIALIVALFLGYIKEFNSRAQAQILDEVTTMTKAGKTTEEIQGYVDDVLSGRENVIIDNTGQERKELYLDKNLKLSEVTTTVTKPYYASVLTYAALTAANASHTSYEAGRKAQNIKDGYQSWIFSGPADERARPWHVAILGSVYTWGTQQSEYAEGCLHERNCRHRAQVYYGDERDVKTEVWERLKEKSGLHWDEDKQQWALKPKERTPKVQNPKRVKVAPTKKAPKIKKVKEVEIKRTPEEVKKTIREHEHTIKDYKVEHGAVFTKNGDLFLQKIGTEDQIIWDAEERALMKSTIMTHTHPNNAGFSSADIRFACGNGLSEMRAVGPSRAYSMYFKDGRDFAPEDWTILEGSFDHNFKMGVAKERMKYKNDTNPDKIWDADKALEHGANYAWGKTVKDVDGLVYKVEVAK